MNTEKLLINCHSDIQAIYCASKIVKAFKELHDLDNEKYYTVISFYERVKNTTLHNSLVSIFGDFEIADYERIITGLNKGCLLHSITELNESKYQFWNIQGGGLLNE